MDLTSDDLVSAVRLRMRLPTATDVTATEILAIADDEIGTTCADLIRNADSSYWLTTHTAPVVSGTATYALPGRAIGAGIERVELEDASGDRRPVVALNEHDSWRWANGARDIIWPAKHGYILEAGKLRLLPTPVESGLTLRVRYQRQPSRLVEVSEAAPITAATSATTLEVASAPTWLASLLSDTLVDVVSGEGAHELIIADGIATAWDGVDEVTLSTPIAVADVAGSSPAGGRRDYLCRAGETVYPAVPATVWPVLVRATVRTLLDSLGDERGASRSQAILEQRIAASRSVVTPRSRQVPTFVNRTSYLRRGR